MARESVVPFVWNPWGIAAVLTADSLWPNTTVSVSTGTPRHTRMEDVLEINDVFHASVGSNTLHSEQNGAVLTVN